MFYRIRLQNKYTGWPRKNGAFSEAFGEVTESVAW